MANYFIDRPVFAWVLAIIMMLAGGLAIMNLPVAQYPQIAPPTITISATYPGADAQTVEDSVTQVIEQNMNGLDGLMYMSSTSDAAGNASITLTFETGTSPDIAQVQVQNKLQLAMPSLPEAVQQQGISVDKSSSNILMVAAFISDNGSLNQYDIADYVASNIKDPLSRTAGVGSVQLFGSEYAMRIWLDPQKLNKYNLVPSDVISQIKVQNNQISGGQLGGMPQAADQQLNASIILPAVAELGTASGFDMELLDNGNLGHEKLTQARNELLSLAAQSPNQVIGVRPNGLEDTPMFKVNVNAAKAEAMGVALSDINQTISTAFGSSYVNDFLNQGRVKKVYVQAGTPFRMLPDNINQWYVRNASGTMAPLSAYSSTEWTYGSPRLERYNGIPSMEILGEAAAGKSTGDAMKFMADLVAKLPAGVGYSWTGLSYQEALSSNQAPALYAISLVVVFLALAALYESWSIPFSVMLVVPLGVVGALLATDLRGLSNDVYFQVGLLTTIGLSAKNAILIVEFAVEMMQKEGKTPVEAIIEAARMRLRPILMTSLAFILGVLPLVISHGAGSGAQNAVGTGVMGGMFAATVLAIYFVPVFFVVVEHLFARFKKA
ncbi:efflux RND transporter permease subunit [Escherichia coli]|nr:efflux RND transporter permease subunit [Escherichia coli]